MRLSQSQGGLGWLGTTVIAGAIALLTVAASNGFMEWWFTLVVFTFLVLPALEMQRVDALRQEERVRQRERQRGESVYDHMIREGRWRP